MNFGLKGCGLCGKMIWWWDIEAVDEGDGTVYSLENGKKIIDNASGSVVHRKCLRNKLKEARKK